MPPMRCSPLNSWPFFSQWMVGGGRPSAAHRNFTVLAAGMASSFLSIRSLRLQYGGPERTHSTGPQHTHKLPSTQHNTSTYTQPTLNTAQHLNSHTTYTEHTTSFNYTQGSHQHTTSFNYTDLAVINLIKLHTRGSK